MASCSNSRAPWMEPQFSWWALQRRVELTMEIIVAILAV
ncbi:hypothetical protein GFS60_07909 (plasmid) [Rhodococcus sp. WAY2]|nr:hypothetical protein GFS60_07909 [Rhodococcus sp. WAY2]